MVITVDGFKDGIKIELGAMKPYRFFDKHL